MGVRADRQSALSADSFDAERYRPALVKKRQRRVARTLARVQTAREFIPVIVDSFLRIDPAIDRIILFGSLARGIPERLDFDIDIGVRSGRFLKLVAWALDQEWKIDVVDIDSLDGSILQGIDSRAEILYER